MYRNLYCKVQRQSNGYIGTTLYLDTWDAEGNPVTRVYNGIKPHLFVEATEENKALATHTSVYNTPLICRDFFTQKQRKNFVEEHSTTRFFENLPVTRQFLLDAFIGKERDDDFRKFPFKIWTIDIEIAVSPDGSFPEAGEAAYPVNLITVHDSILDKYFIWYLPHTKEEKITMPYIEEGEDDAEETKADMAKRHYMRFDSEEKMLADFFDFWQHNRPDVLTGWNVSAYDMPYLFNRGNKILGMLFDVASSLSPTGNVYYVHDDNLMSDILKITGVSILDYMYLFKFKFEKGKPSYALNAILDDELGKKKLDHDEYKSFYEFYTSNFSKYMEYNIKDVKRVVQLDHKKKFIDLTRVICNLGLVEYESIYHTLPYVQGAVTCQAKRNGKIFLTDSGLPEYEGEFKGAYVHDTRAGFYKHGGFTYDLNSLYPSVMIMLNCSPETKIGKISVIGDGETMNWEDAPTVSIRTENGKVIELTHEKLEKLLNTKCCVSANGVLYVKPEIQKGVMPEFLEWLYAERRATKNRGLKAEIEINELRVKGITTGEKVEELETYHTLCDNTQKAYKIMLNSVYGIIGLRHYCCFDKDNAEAVTQSGKKVITTSLGLIADGFKREFGYTGEHPTLAGDTDSLMNNGEAIYHMLFGDRKIEWTEEEVKLFKAEAQKICDGLNKDIGDFCEGYFHSSLRRIEFKLETCYSHAIFLKRKHYVYRKVDDEGSYMVGSPKQFKMTGIDIKRNQIPKPVQKVLKKCIEDGMLEEWDSAKFNSYIMNEYDKFLQMPVEDIALKFAYRTECESVGFLKMAPRAHITAKVATFYNQMIEELKIKNQDIIRLGEDARYVYVKPYNEYGVNVMGFKENWPKEFEEIFDIDRETMFSKIYLSKLEHFAEIFGWIMPDPKNIPVVDLYTFGL